MITNFLCREGIWSGEFYNFVNQQGGIVQQGRIELKAEVPAPDLVVQKTGFIRPDGSRTGYQGEAKIAVRGKQLINPEPPEKDENTGNPLEDYRFEGYVGEGHIHILEQYVEKSAEGSDERRNEIHYCQLDGGDVLMISSVYVNGQLLVFARAVLSHSAE